MTVSDEDMRKRASFIPARTTEMEFSEIDAAAFDRWLAKVKADALREAAASIPEQMRLDELAIHDLNYTHELPELSRTMLNGATRFAERLFVRAYRLELEAAS